jgi:hypothetical protein
LELPDDLIQQINEIETDESSPYCQLKLRELAAEDRRIDENIDGVSDPIVGYAMGFDSIVTHCTGGDWDYDEWMAVRMSYMRCAAERFWQHTVRDAYIYGQKDGRFAGTICEGPVGI